MSNRCVWIDDIDIEIEGPVVRAVAVSDGSRNSYRMARSAFRAYVERAIRQLDEADERDRCQILAFRQAG